VAQTLMQLGPDPLLSLPSRTSACLGSDDNIEILVKYMHSEINNLISTKSYSTHTY